MALHVCVSACVGVHVHVPVNTRRHIPANTCTYRKYIYVHTYTPIYAYVCTPTHTCYTVCIHTHRYMHASM